MNKTSRLLTAAAIIGIGFGTGSDTGGAAWAQTTPEGHGTMPMSDPMPTGNADHANTAPTGDMDAASLQTMMQGMMPSADDSPSTRDFKAADMQMMHGMRVGYTGDPDVDFRTHMIPHHEGAIDMAKVALAHARSPETKRMAQQIIDDQEREIAEMQAWLQANGGQP